MNCSNEQFGSSRKELLIRSSTKKEIENHKYNLILSRAQKSEASYEELQTFSQVIGLAQASNDNNKKNQKNK